MESRKSKTGSRANLLCSIKFFSGKLLIRVPRAAAQWHATFQKSTLYIEFIPSYPRGGGYLQQEPEREGTELRGLGF